MENSTQSEAIVIGMIITEPKLLKKAVECGLHHTYFYNRRLSSIFKLFERYYKKNYYDFDIAIIYKDMQKNHCFMTDVSELTRLSTDSIIANDIISHCKAIISASEKRCIATGVTDILNSIERYTITELKDSLSKVIEDSSITADMENVFLSVQSSKKERNLIVAKTGLKELDKRLDGLHSGTLTILSGDSGTGKSTFLNQVIAENVAVGTKCFLFSGELTDGEIGRWLSRTVANDEDLMEKPTKFDGFTYEPTSEAKFQIDNWLKNRLFIYNNEIDSSIDNMEKSINYLSSEHGVKLFIIDNMMMITTEKDDQNASDAEIARRLKAVARKNNVAVILVAHNKKNKDVENVSMYDIAGSSKITNLADTIIAMKRMVEQSGDGNKVRFAITKNRTTGYLDSNIIMSFDNKRKRFFEYFDTELNRDYGYRVKASQLTI